MTRMNNVDVVTKAGDAIESTKDIESTEAVEAMEVSQDNRKPADVQR